jgi:5-methylcytosine-specific restriction protein A
VIEGRILYRVHKTRERKRSAEKKRAVMEATGRLECEVCGFDFFETYGERGNGSPSAITSCSSLTAPARPISAI